MARSLLARRLLSAALLATALGCGGAAYQYSPPSAGQPAPPPAAPDLDAVPVVERAPFPDMRFRHYGVNPTIDTEEEPVSTFSVDVDTAAYTMARAYLERGHLPEPSAVRVEEFVNWFSYQDQPPANTDVFSIHAEAFPSPNRKGYHVLRLGLKAREVAAAERPPAHLTFVVDVSGSMQREDRLGLVRRALALLVGQLGAGDTVAIVGYAGAATVLLGPVGASVDREAVLRALDQLAPRGSTSAQAGLELGYQVAARQLGAPGIHRVILCSDGVANNGITEPDALVARVRGYADEGIGLTAVGFGMGNYDDVLMERLAQNADGQYHYVDRMSAARRVFGAALGGTLQTVAKDVKVQVQFDAAQVARYRLLGYENRVMHARDFADDRKDAGELGAGHAVTALYEVKFRAAPRAAFATLRVRYKAPTGGASQLLEAPIGADRVHADRHQGSGGARLALVAAGFAEKLRGAYWARTLGYEDLLAQLDGLPEGWRADPAVVELRGLIERARSLDDRPDRFERVLPVASMDFDHVPVVQ